MWVGAWRNKTDTPYKFKWPQEPIQALGIFFSYNSDAANNMNFGEKIIKLKNTLKNWKRRKLTLYGRIKIVKTLTLGLSKLIYNTSVLEITYKIFRFYMGRKTSQNKKKDNNK